MGYWAYKKADGMILYGGGSEAPLFDGATVSITYIDGAPDTVAQRVDQVTGALRAATQAEIDALLATFKDKEIDDFRAVRALAQAVWEQLPTATRPTAAAFIQRIKTIYRGL